ncbi:MAG: hypothetical protein J6B06_02295 [Lachnospiraceae bacterium]|nr:hypothetical protein [Lachnospiraceae bacterium]
MEKYDRVIFVSTDDTCKGPMAEGVMRGLIEGRKLTTASRGMVVLFSEPINPKADAAARSCGVLLNHPRTVQFCEQDMNDRTLVLTMTEQQKKTIYEQYETAINVYTINEFLDGEGDIEDPTGGEMPVYVECFERISVLVKLVAEKLFLEDEQI